MGAGRCGNVVQPAKYINKSTLTLKVGGLAVSSEKQGFAFPAGRYVGHKRGRYYFNPLNDELNPICHLLILLGDLTFMGKCIVSIFQYISNKMQRYTFYLYLETALHVSGGTSTAHPQKYRPGQYLLFVFATVYM
jgi:hypothetical protein